MLTQQTLLRTYMKTNHMKRKEFAARHEVAERRLATWLLPENSTNFRRVPEALLLRIESELMSGLDGLVIEQKSEPEYENERITFENCGSIIRFPILWLVEKEGPLHDFRQNPETGEFEEFDTGHRHSLSALMLFHGEYRVELMNAETETTRPLLKPQLVGGIPYWTFITHHRSNQEIEGLYQANEYRREVAETSELPEMEDVSAARVDGEYFSLVSLPAPKFHPHPLFIYKARALTDTKSRGVIPDIWTRCVDENGVVTNEVPYAPEPDLF